MTMRRAALLISLALVLAACGGGDDDDGGADGGGGAGDQNGARADVGAELPECPLDALASAPKPVEISLWHAMTRANEEELTRLAEEFNSAQSDVRVSLSASPSYSENLTRFRSAIGTAQVPDLVQIEDTGLQQMVDSGAILPAQACIEADSYDTTDHVERVLAYYSVQDVLWPMPFNVSNPILYYNKVAFEKAGLDPETPPTTLDELREAAQAIVEREAAPYGLAFKIQPWFIEHWLAMAGQAYVDNGNGRNDRATSVAFDSDAGVELFTWLKGMYDDKLLLSTGSAEGNIDHYLAVGNGEAAMTIDTSAALGTIFQLLNSGQFADVDLGAGALPGPSSEDGGSLVGGAALYIVDEVPPENQAAAYEFAKFLNDPQNQAEWAAATGYIPIRRSSLELSPLVERWAEQPELRIAYDQLLAGAENDVTAGPVIGAYGSVGVGVRGAVIDAITGMFDSGTSPEDAIAEAVQAANAAIEEYNSRVE